MLNRHTFAIFLGCLLLQPSINAHAETLQPSEAEVLGISLQKYQRSSVRKHLYSIGGFIQAEKSFRQINYDTFYAWSRVRDTYYIRFNYNQAGRITSVERVFRPYSNEFDNNFSDLTTRRVAEDLAKTYGNPIVLRKATGRYKSYIWEDENVKIEVDRKGSDPFGNVFIRYTLLKNDPFQVATR